MNDKKIVFLASSTINDVFTHFEQLEYLDFYTLIKLSVILPHGVCDIKQENFKFSGTSKKMFGVSQVKSIYTKTRYRYH
jgi:hypothetical protein